MSDNKPLIFTAYNGIKIRIDADSDPRNVAMVKDLRLEGEEESNFGSCAAEEAKAVIGE